MKQHPRERQVDDAEQALRQALVDWEHRHTDLTRGERLAVLTSVFGGRLGLMSKYMIREERHDDPDRPGGLA